jgi:hypothetical protein
VPSGNKSGETGATETTKQNDDVLEPLPPLAQVSNQYSGRTTAPQQPENCNEDNQLLLDTKEVLRQAENSLRKCLFAERRTALRIRGQSVYPSLDAQAGRLEPVTPHRLDQIVTNSVSLAQDAKGHMQQLTDAIRALRVIVDSMPLNVPRKR